MNEVRPPKAKRRWNQISMKLFLVAFVALSLILGWIGIRVQAIQREMSAAVEIEQLGGRVGRAVLERQQPYYFKSNYKRIRPFDMWLRGRLNTGNPVNSVELHNTPVTDADLVLLGSLPNLEELSLDGTAISDSGLAYVSNLDKLSVLTLSGTRVTDAGLVYLKTLSHLTRVEVACNEVTNDGLDALRKALPTTQIVRSSSWAKFEIELRGGKIQGFDPVTSISGGRQFTDADMVNLKSLPTLEYVDLQSTLVTDAGLEHIKELAKLEGLDLRGTQVTEEGIKKLQQALPNCEIRH